MTASVKYALWTINNEPCVIIGGDLVTARDRRLIYRDASKLMIGGYITADAQLTHKGQQSAPTDISYVSKFNAMRAFKSGKRFVMSDQHAVADDGTKISRYLTEVLVKQGLLRMDPGGVISVAPAETTNTYVNALWALSQGGCYVVNGDLWRDGCVVFSDAHRLILNGYMTEDVTITEMGRRVIPKSIGYSTQQQVLAAIDGCRNFRFNGNFAEAEDGSRLSRYHVERLIEVGKLIIGPGGCIMRPRKIVHIAVYEDQVQECMTLLRTLTLPPAT